MPIYMNKTEALYIFKPPPTKTFRAKNSEAFEANVSNLISQRLKSLMFSVEIFFL